MLAKGHFALLEPSKKIPEGQRIVRVEEKMRRILIYSHDSFGLGHLRRCWGIAYYLTKRQRDLSVLILSGSPLLGHFSFPPRVDFLRLPGLVKQPDGRYAALSLSVALEEILALRARLIFQSSLLFRPDVFLVDKEPLGIGGEVRPALELLSKTKTRCVVGLRDVMDAPATLHEEWNRKKTIPALAALYSTILIYGEASFYDPLKGLMLPSAIQKKIFFTGYLRKSAEEALCECGAAQLHAEKLPFRAGTYLLVTPGGGGDGAMLIDWVLRVYENQAHLSDRSQDSSLLPAVIVIGPFMSSSAQNLFLQRAKTLPNVLLLRFTSSLLTLLRNAAGVVGMGGYNTFCEILSFDKPALLVPRTKPRQEQLIRSLCAQKAGLARFLSPDFYPDLEKMACALRKLPAQPRPSLFFSETFLEGLPKLYQILIESTQAEANL